MESQFLRFIFLWTYNNTTFFSKTLRFCSFSSVNDHASDSYKGSLITIFTRTEINLDDNSFWTEYKQKFPNIDLSWILFPLAKITEDVNFRKH